MSDWVLTSDYEKNKRNKTFPSKPSEWSLTKNPEEESFLSKFPRNAKIGLSNLNQTLLNSPYEISRNLENQAQQFGEGLNNILPAEYQALLNQMPKHQQNNISDYIPHVPEQNFSQLYGQKGEPTFSDKLVQKGFEFAPELVLGGYGLNKILPHLTRRGASKKLNRAQQLGIERNMGPLDINPQLIEDTRQFLPTTSPYQNAIENALNGNYQDLFQLQSDVGKHARGYGRSLFAAERAHGREANAAKNRLLDAMQQSLESSGNLDISDLLREGRNDYRRYMAFRPYRNILAAGAAASLLPKNALINIGNKILSQK